MTPKRIIEVAENQLGELHDELNAILACCDRALMYLEAARNNIGRAKEALK